MDSEAIPGAQDMEDKDQGEQAASERSCAESIARFYEENAAAIMCWASEVVPLPESERTDKKRICAGVVEASLHLAKVASRVVWGLQTSDRCHDDNTDFSKIAYELDEAFNNVKDALPFSSGAKVSMAASCSSASASRRPSPALPTSDIYQGQLPSDGISPGQIIEDIQYCVPSAGAHHDSSTPLTDNPYATAGDTPRGLAHAFQVVAQELSIHLAHSLKETVSRCVDKAVDERLEDNLFEDRISASLAKRLLPELTSRLQHAGAQSRASCTGHPADEDHTERNIKRPRTSE